ncbi:hypothetical protein BDR26DRAFT_1005332 [Obelidium mucronatum]|nr:hypothetical protein BDR26DRAFT_1005332 [Obelidium mucronatum]
MDYALHQDETFQKITTAALSILSAISFLNLVLLVYLIYTHSPKGTLRSALSLKNSLLIGLSVSQIGYLVSHACYIYFPISAILSIIEAIFLASWEIFFIWVSWTRSVDMFRVTSSQSVVSVFRWIVILTTVATIVPPVTIMVQFDAGGSQIVYLGSILVSAVGIFALDTYFMVSYLLYTFQRTVETVEIKGYGADVVHIFRLIARFGLFSSMATFVCLCLVGAIAVVSSNPQGKVIEYAILIMLTDTASFFATLGLILLKVKLLQFRAQKNPREKK